MSELAAQESLGFTTIDAAVEEYIKTRDELKEIRQEFKAKEDAHKAYLERISMWIREKADAIGVDSFKTKSGTAYRATKTQYRMTSWDDFVAWIKETGNFHCLEKRVAKLATAEIHEETGVCPPGVELHVETEFDVRRA